MIELPLLQADLERVRTELEKILSESWTKSLLSEFSLLGGKLLRPSLLLLSARLTQGEQNFQRPLPLKMYVLAAALECVHVASCIHDDIIDESDFRRGESSVVSSAGIKKAVLAGDMLFARAYQLIVSYVSKRNLGLVSQVLVKICGAEIDEYADSRSGKTSAKDSEKKESIPSMRQYLRRIYGKTAMMFVLAAHSGFAEMRGKGPALMGLRRYGYCLGMGFQIQDDLLDVEASLNITGKSSGKDKQNGVFTLPAILESQGIMNGLETARGYSQGYFKKAMREIEAIKHQWRGKSSLTHLFSEFTEAVACRCY